MSDSEKALSHIREIKRSSAKGDYTEKGSRVVTDGPPSAPAPPQGASSVANPKGTDKKE